MAASKSSSGKPVIGIKPSHKGRLHAALGVAADKPIPPAKLAAAAKSKNPAIRKEAVFAQNAKGFSHSSGSKAPMAKKAAAVKKTPKKKG
jgi:hypothetical protein